jgi:hypothetical protein
LLEALSATFDAERHGDRARRQIVDRVGKLEVSAIVGSAVVVRLAGDLRCAHQVQHRRRVRRERVDDARPQQLPELAGVDPSAHVTVDLLVRRAVGGELVIPSLDRALQADDGVPLVDLGPIGTAVQLDGAIDGSRGSVGSLPGSPVTNAVG